jgi:hypothetical protein
LHSPRRTGTAQRFLGLTKIDLSQIRDVASTPDFLAGVLEHMLADESPQIAFAGSAGIDPAGILRARSTLGGS